MMSIKPTAIAGAISNKTPGEWFGLLVGLKGPFGTLWLFMVVGFLWLSLARVVFAVWQWPRLTEVPDLWRMFALGARLDLALLAYLLALPLFIQALLPRTSVRRWLTALSLSAAATVIVFMELATPAFFIEYDHRPDRIFFEYLLYPREVFSMLFKSRPLASAILLPLPVMMAWGFWRYWNGALKQEQPSSYPARIALFLPVFILLFVTARGLDHRPLNLSAASFSGNRIANDLAANSTFSVAYAAYSLRHEADAARLYGSMPWPEVLMRVRKYMDAPPARYTHPDIPTLHPQTEPRRFVRPLNLVILIQESLGAAHVGKLGGLPLTPNLDRLAEQGLWFTNLYGTGTRTSRGMEAIVAGFPPTPAPAVLKLSRAQRGFFTLGSLLQRQGYFTEFIYGGVANFDNMRSFYLGNGFDRVIEQKDFADPEMLGSWGVSDEDWVRKAHETFVAHGEQPFFAVMLSTTNHEPFEFPAGHIEPYEQPLNTRYNAMKYADHALGKFFDMARQADYFKNTVFLVVADHEARVYGADLLPLRHFRVPALILGPGIQPGVERRVASQIDLAPTLLHLLGVSTEHPMPGRDLLELPEKSPGRAPMQFEKNFGFRVGNELVVHTPGREAQTFVVGPEDGLIPSSGNPELTRDALAQVLWASEAYNRQMYRLPSLVAVK